MSETSSIKDEVEQAVALQKEGLLWQAENAYQNIIAKIKAKADTSVSFNTKKALYDEISLLFDRVQNIQFTLYTFRVDSGLLKQVTFDRNGNNDDFYDIFTPYLDGEVKEIVIVDQVSFTRESLTNVLRLLTEFKNRCPNLTYIKMKCQKSRQHPESDQVNYFTELQENLESCGIKFKYELSLEPRFDHIICLSTGIVFEIASSFDEIYSTPKPNEDSWVLKIWHSPVFENCKQLVENV